MRNHDASNNFAGSAVVTSASYGPKTTMLQLQTFAGERIDVVLEDKPDAAGAAAVNAGLRPVSVKILLTGEPCSVFLLSPQGPHSVDVTVGVALALYQSGVRAVVDGGLQLDVTCSTRKRTGLRFPSSLP
ncbi:hypothetical protein RM50_18355 [Pseudarthrobacter phenanthrenivorans]|uniref:Uncharacterized protein n=1 Tax=Pseudarthrobacter phenanthrenivorans TaxID=361575 RepID=A0A0B4EB14_PSEPS|nr:hypothetical protein RM50_18355 [Pseudarthrobacter phenanthrenivorans]